MTISDKLYNINRQISLHYIAMQKVPQQHEIREINMHIADCIKEIRETEENLASFRNAIVKLKKEMNTTEDELNTIETLEQIFNTLFPEK